jgi:oligopeptide/dipeptide ABC transporter ATP-binding protein
MAILEITDLRCGFRTRSGTLQAVDGVSFSVDTGETIGIVGESGCGKSVTALSILRLLPPDRTTIEGRIVFDGADILDMSDDQVRRIRGRGLGMVFQDPMSSLNPVVTIGQQIAEALRQHLDLDRAAARERVVELLESVGIPNAAARADNYPHQFSGGMRQRVMIAMALSCRPKVILADEITTALDVTIQAQILDLLRNLVRESQTALVMITHDLGVVAGMTQRVHVMYAGQIVESAGTDELFDRPSMPYTWGLLRSSTRLDDELKERLTPIEGMPPNLVRPPQGCRFEPRCPYSRDICRQQSPGLVPLTLGTPDHQTRCWGMQDVPEGGWLRDHDWRLSPAPTPPTEPRAQS